MMPQNSDNCNEPLVNWDAGVLLPAPRQKRPEQRERFYPVRCANRDCSLVRWLTKNDAERAEAEQRICRRCQTTMAGKRGYAATAARYGSDFALRAVRQHQIENPSTHEQIVDSWLVQLKVDYERQVEFAATDEAKVEHHFILDFVIYPESGNPIVVEVNGYYHNRYRADRDFWLIRLYPGEVLFIDTENIDSDPEGVQTTIRQVLQWKP